MKYKFFNLVYSGRIVINVYLKIVFANIWSIAYGREFLPIPVNVK